MDYSLQYENRLQDAFKQVKALQKEKNEWIDEIKQRDSKIQQLQKLHQQQVQPQYTEVVRMRCQ